MCFTPGCGQSSTVIPAASEQQRLRLLAKDTGRGEQTAGGGAGRGVKDKERSRRPHCRPRLLCGLKVRLAPAQRKTQVASTVDRSALTAVMPLTSEGLHQPTRVRRTHSARASQTPTGSKLFHIRQERANFRKR